MDMTRSAHLAAEAISLLTVIAVLGKLLPYMASLLCIIWYCVVLWESRTGRWWRQRWAAFFWFVVQRRGLTVEDKMAMFFLAMFGGGVTLLLLAVERIMN